MKNRYISLCFVCLLVASCSVQEMDNINQPVSRSSFFARIEAPAGAETKAYVDNDLRVLWDAEDCSMILS